MKELAAKLREVGVGDVIENAPLAGHTSYRVGGPAALLVQPTDIQALLETVRAVRAADEPQAVIGWGSNLIVADDGFPGVVIKLAPDFRYVRLPDPPAVAGETATVTVGAATMNAHLVRTLHRAGYSGAEYLALVPGTFGGAVAMNAGTRQGEVKDCVERVRIVTPDGQLHTLSAEQLAFDYRHAEIPADSIVVEADIAVQRSGVSQGQEQVRQERDYRNRTQPYHQPSAGSVFKNPPGDFAGRLIEAAGLKGRRHGKATISKVHANFIVTDPGARSADILALMALMRFEVQRQLGVALWPEQRLLGFGDRTLVELLDELAESFDDEGGEA